MVNVFPSDCCIEKRQKETNVEVERQVRRLIEWSEPKMMMTWTRDGVKKLKSGWVLHTYFESSTEIFAHREDVVKREKGVENDSKDFDLSTWESWVWDAC